MWVAERRDILVVASCFCFVFVFGFCSAVVYSAFSGQTKTKQTRAAHTLSMATTTIATPADISARDRNGHTKIFLAAEAGDAAEVARLLELQADFELPATNLNKYVSFLNDKKFINFIQFDSTQLHATSYCLQKGPRASCSFVAQSRREDRSNRRCRVCMLCLE